MKRRNPTRKTSDRNVPTIVLPKSDVIQDVEEENIENKGGDNDSNEDLNKFSSEFILMGQPRVPSRKRSTVTGTLLSLAEERAKAHDATIKVGQTWHDDYDLASVDSNTNKSEHGQRSRLKREQEASLEAWWIGSPVWRRTAVFMCITLLFLTILNAAVAIYFFTKPEHNVTDPYVCMTQNCKQISDWVANSLNQNVDPCDDFYEYVCGNHDARVIEDVPDHTDFKEARSDFDGHAAYANILKHTPENTEKIIPFFKACLDRRSRDRNNLNTFVQVINETIGDFFDKDIQNWHTNQTDQWVQRGPGRIIATTGYYATHSFQLGKYPDIALLPPAEWILDLGERLKSNSEVFNVSMSKVFRAIWDRLNFTHSPMTSDEASAYFIRYLRVVSNASKSVPEDQRDQKFSDKVNENIELYVENAFGRKYPIKPVALQSSRDARFYLSRIEEDLAKEFFGKEIPLSSLTSFIFNMLEYFSEDLKGTSFKELDLDIFFPHLKFQFLKSDERYCFDSIIYYLNGYTVLRLIQAYQPNELEELTEQTLEISRSVHRAFRKIYSTTLKSLLPSHHDLVTRHYASYQNLVNIVVPFLNRFNKNTFTRIAEYYDSYKPGPNYFHNIYTASKLYYAGRINDWRNNRIDELRRRVFLFEEIEVHTDNSLEYENNIYPPITLFNRPFISRDLRLFTAAGTTLYMARSLIELWKRNIELLERDNDGPLAKIMNISEWNFLKKNKLKIKDFSLCYENGTEVYILSNTILMDALAFKLGLELFINPSEYETLRDPITKELKSNIKPLYHANGSVRWVDITEDGTETEVNKDDFDHYIPKSFKLKYTKAPGILKDMTPEQTFFMTAVRHHCYAAGNQSENRNKLKEGLNNALGQLSEFPKAWNCSTNAPMNLKRKCF